VQVLNEFASFASRKLAMTIAEIREILSTIRAVCIVKPLDIDTHELGLDMAERYGFSIYDGLIVAVTSAPYFCFRLALWSQHRFGR
jgi:predicted nucleic acid-binding protein